VPAHLLARLHNKRPSVFPPVLPLGDPAIDRHLPDGGLLLGQLHEIGAEGLAEEIAAATAGFVACLLARLPKTRSIVWIAQVNDLYPPGLPDCGLDPGRLILAETANNDATLAAMEVALRGGAAIAVVGEVARFDRTASRRLQLACLDRGSTCFVLRRFPRGRGAVAERETSVAVTRWQLAAMPSATEEQEPGVPRWRADLAYARGGRPGSWLIEKEAPNAPHPVRVVAALADHAADPCCRRAG
jgi:protein ImuA